MAGDGGIPPADLDQCQGHVDEAHPFYHYHLPQNRAFPFTTACLMGCVDLSVWTFTNPVNPAYIGPNCSDVAAKQYDYSSVKGLYEAAIQNQTAVAPTFVFAEYVTATQPLASSPPPSPAPPNSPSPKPSPKPRPSHRHPPPPRKRPNQKHPFTILT